MAKNIRRYGNTTALKALSALLLVFILGLPLSWAGPGEGRWRLIGRSTTDTLWYIDTATITYPSKDIVSVWIKSIPAKSYTAESEDARQTGTLLRQIQERYFGDYEVTEGLWEFNCSQIMFRILYFSACDRNGDTITSTLSPDAGWSSIMPGSVGEVVHEAVCDDAHI